MVQDAHDHRIVNVYYVAKFYPPRCPNCERSFRSWDDMTEFYGNNNQASNSAIAQADWWDRWPEIWERLPGKIRGYKGNPYSLDFIFCRHCGNVTMRIMYAQRQVMSLDEAERLIKEEGFTFISEGGASGYMAQPFTKLSWLAKSDLAMLESVVKEGRMRAQSAHDERVGGDIFAATVDKALTEIVMKNQEAARSDEVERLLRDLFGSLWKKLEPQSRDFLMTAELLKHELSSYAETNPSVDFAPVVQSYSKALERTLLEKLFVGFAKSPYATDLPPETGKKDFDNSVLALQKLVSGRHDITLGSMAFCLLNVGCKMKHYDENGFAEFLHSIIGDLDEFCSVYRFPARLNDYVNNYRNRAAHVSKITKEECMSARAFLLEEPIKLLVLLEQLIDREERG